MARVDPVSAEKPQWTELFNEVVTGGLCTGCAGCVIACPHDVLSYDDANGVYKPFHLDIDGDRSNCTHGEKGCTMCTRACPRFRTWEEEIDVHRHKRTRNEDEVFGVTLDIVLARTTDPELAEVAQDGGFVSALLTYALEHDVIDGALVSAFDEEKGPWRTKPALVTDRAGVIATAGSRYTYCANTLSYPEAAEAKLERLALVGMGCQASVSGAMQARRAGKVARRLGLTIGLLCSKTFDDAIFEELFEPNYGVKREDIVKMNIKGVFQLWLRDGRYVEVPLKECHAYTREGCKSCPDFAAEHADLSTGGIGESNDWTLVLVRTEQGKALLDQMASEGAVELRPGSEDPGALALLAKLSQLSRKRWPETADPAPRRIPVRAS